MIWKANAEGGVVFSSDCPVIHSGERKSPNAENDRPGGLSYCGTGLLACRDFYHGY